MERDSPRWEPVSRENRNSLRLGEGDTGMGRVSRWKPAKTTFTTKPVGE